MFSAHFKSDDEKKLNQNETFMTIVGQENDQRSEASDDQENSSAFLTPCATVTAVEVYTQSSSSEV